MIHHGDCRAFLAGLDACSIDAIVTDPPYGLEFMGVAWDTMREKGTPRARNEWQDFGSREHARHPSEVQRIRHKSGTAFQAFTESWAREALRVLKPGAHLVAFGGSRTYHRLACAVEDAGFEIRDQLQWIYGSGFPKSWNFSTQYPGEWCDCGEPARIQHASGTLDDGALRNGGCCPRCGKLKNEYRGFSSALKPAHEPIVLARKPLIGTVAANVAQHGTGALNIDGCRIEWDDGAKPFGGGAGHEYSGRTVSGRWPANVVLDEEVAEGMGEVSRYFYCPKSSRAERNAGLEGLPERARPGAFDDDNYEWKQPGGHVVARPAQNHHPTVKPIALMRWLCRLITPPGGLIFDPFMGSGSTGCAAVLEEFQFIGCDMDAEYVEIARRRIAHHGRQPALALT